MRLNPLGWAAKGGTQVLDKIQHFKKRGKANRPHRLRRQNRHSPFFSAEIPRFVILTIACLATLEPEVRSLSRMIKVDVQWHGQFNSRTHAIPWAGAAVLGSLWRKGRPPKLDQRFNSSIGAFKWVIKFRSVCAISVYA